VICKASFLLLPVRNQISRVWPDIALIP